jgi:hypothetical protein
MKGMMGLLRRLFRCGRRRRIGGVMAIDGRALSIGMDNRDASIADHDNGLGVLFLVHAAPCEPSRIVNR